MAKTWRQTWDERRERNRVSPDIHAKRVGGRIQVVCPYNPKFIEGAKFLAGKWRQRSHVWSFKGERWTAIQELIKSVYGDVVELK